WICKRTPNLTYEAMECIGGSGVMEDSIMPRLFRESPINPIWEGSGNVQCLDVLRAIGRQQETAEALFAEVGQVKGADGRFDQFLARLQQDFGNGKDLEYRSRDLVDRMALAMQASLLIRAGNAAVADAFCAGRLEG